MRIVQPLRNRAFAGLWLSYSASIVATAILPTALTLMILDWKNGIADLGIALSARTFGFLAGAVAGGYFADNWSRQRVLSSASALRSVAVLVIAWVPHANILSVSCCLFFAGAGEGTFRSAYQASMADLVPGDQLQSANALTTLSMRIALTVGPLIAVALHGRLGPLFGLQLAGALWALSALASLTLQRRLHACDRTTPASGTNILADFRAGLAEAFRHRWFVAGLAALLVWLGLGNSVQQLMLPVISRAHLGGDAFIGIALGAYSVGALAGGIAMGSMRMRRPGALAFCGLALFGLVPLALATHSAILIISAYFLGGIGIELFNIPWFTAIQNEVPKEMLGRISSIDFLISYGAAPLALAAMPAALAAIGPGNALVSIGLIVATVPIIALLVPSAPEFKEPRR
ncbi:MFS transporter [Mesorhizobium sp. B2-3-3]|nr:MFS transporter [Mesorhizobium sp. B2-3-3]